MYKFILNLFLDFLYPKNCLGCNKDGFYICPSCFNKTYPPDHRDLPSWVTTIKSYKDPIIRKSIWFLKYRKRFDIAGELSSYIYDELMEELTDLKTFYNFTDPYLVPIPVHKKTLRDRGFNQAEKLAQALIKIDKGKNLKILINALQKIKNTGHQAKIKNKKERMINLKGSFAVKKPELVKNKNIILVDDVITTSATLCEAKKVLEKAGARKVVAFTLAH